MAEPRTPFAHRRTLKWRQRLFEWIKLLRRGRTETLLLAEQMYHEILLKNAGINEFALREQESALIQLGELYCDQKYFTLLQGHVLTEIIDK
jgi:hypothetical protein